MIMRGKSVSLSFLHFKLQTGLLSPFIRVCRSQRKEARIQIERTLWEGVFFFLLYRGHFPAAIKVNFSAQIKTLKRCLIKPFFYIYF